MRFSGLLSLFAASMLLVAAQCFPALAEEFVVVTNRVVYPGETIVRQAVEEVPVRNGRNDLSTVARMPGQVVGKVARRTLLPRRFIPLNTVRDTHLVEQGAAVQVFFVEGGLTISVSGISLEPGSAGDFIKVRNADSGVVISGTVMADGTIRVGAI